MATSTDYWWFLIAHSFKCVICGHYKDHEYFSKKQLNTYRDRVASGQRLTSESAKLRCFACNGESALELECMGPCGKKKELSEFSKNSRRTGRNVSLVLSLIFLLFSSPQTSIADGTLLVVRGMYSLEGRPGSWCYYWSCTKQ